MEGRTVETHLLAIIVNNIIQKFVKWNSRASFGKAKYNHIDLTLSKQGTNYYSIQVTNYGQRINDILQFSNNVFHELISNESLAKNTSLAAIYVRNENSDCQTIYDLCFQEKRLSLNKRTNDTEFLSCSYSKEYFSFRLKYKLNYRDTEKFNEIVVNEIVSLQRSNSDTKFTYQRDRKMIYNNHVPLDDEYRFCQTLSVALTKIIQQSLNMKFKKSCFTALKIDNSHQAETALMARLLPLIHENYTFSSESNDLTNIDDESISISSDTDS